MADLTPDRLAELRRIAEAAVPGKWSGQDFQLAITPRTALALLDEIERLRREVREWMCYRCNTVYPGPPQPGIWCVQCPQCGGDTAPRGVIERRRLEREVERLQQKAQRANALAVTVEQTLKAWNMGDYLTPFMDDLRDALLDFEEYEEGGATDGR